MHYGPADCAKRFEYKYAVKSVYSCKWQLSWAVKSPSYLGNSKRNMTKSHQHQKTQFGETQHQPRGWSKLFSMVESKLLARHSEWIKHKWNKDICGVHSSAVHNALEYPLYFPCNTWACKKLFQVVRFWMYWQTIWQSIACVSVAIWRRCPEDNTPPGA